ncbi:hypothetical protein M0R04_03795 [Candidatus Dojkabacteria bacterium]|jgi:hypothetical protein|nr:hypothetical protein [Candidatus Dojkabacteria bacterium]
MSEPITPIKTEEKKKFENLSGGGKTINLIPNLTHAEVKIEKKKIQLNTTSAVALVLFALLTLIIVGVNIFTKLDLNTQKKKLYALESTLGSKSELILGNDEILRRVDLYNKIAATTVSSKDVVLYFQTISSGFGTFEVIKLTGGTAFTLSGSARNLTNVSKLWYLLGNDVHIESVNLKSVVKDSSNARFTFEGVILPESFKTSAQ